MCLLINKKMNLHNFNISFNSINAYLLQPNQRGHYKSLINYNYKTKLQEAKGTFYYKKNIPKKFNLLQAISFNRHSSFNIFFCFFTNYKKVFRSWQAYIWSQSIYVKLIESFSFFYIFDSKY